MIDPKLNDEEERQLLGEVLADKLQAILEYVEDIPAIKRYVQTLKTDVEELKTDMKVVKAVLADHSQKLREHDVEIAELKALL